MRLLDKILRREPSSASDTNDGPRSSGPTPDPTPKSNSDEANKDVLDQPLTIRPLYPESHAAEHKVYLDALKLAFEDPDIRNIAITGSYGAGKSSVLKDFVAGKEKRVISISFSTLGAQIPRYEVSSVGTNSHETDAIAKSNLIQKEIVKQILYRERYDNLPASRFPHIYQAPFGRVLFYSLALTIGTLLAIWSLKIFTATSFTPLGAATLATLLYLATVCLVNFSLPLLNKIGLEKINGGPVSITLSGAKNYFDQYLEEIIYFFVSTKCDIVILEDLDRFDDLYIFETLRQLNNLLNSSKQVGDHTIRFIYAVKDSVFNTESGNSEWNRTKFFDLIIPLVPFVTYKTSRDVMISMFSNKYEVSKEAVGLVSRHIADMRFINNVYNEFEIFNKVIFGTGKIKGLTPSNLFAVIVYKNKYLEDFELLKSGKSMLHKVLAAKRSFIQGKVGELNSEIAEANKKIDSVDGAATLSNKYGIRLLSEIQDILDSHSGYLENVQFKSKSYATGEQLRSKNLWSDIAEANPADRISIQFKQKGQQYGQVISDSSLTIQRVREAVGDKLDFNSWEDYAIKEIRAQIKRARDGIGAVRGQSIKELADQDLAFRETLLKVTEPGLLNELVMAGLIDEHYMLYTSVYREESVSANGMTYIIQTIQDGQRDMLFKFADDQEIRSTLAELDPVDFEDRKIYNVDILDYMLKKNHHQLSAVAGNLLAGTPDDTEFLTIFIRDSVNPDLLFAKLTRAWPGVFHYIVSSETIEKKIKLHLFDVAVANSSDKLNYVRDESINNFIIENAAEIPSITSSSEDTTAQKIRHMLHHFQTKLLNLGVIRNQTLLSFVAENNLYMMSAANLITIIGNDDLALDKIRSTNLAVFERSCTDLREYLEAIVGVDGTNFTINASDAFIDILNRLEEQDTGLVDAVIDNAAPDCKVEDLASVPASQWGPLLARNRIGNTVKNIFQYFEFAGHQVDDILKAYLESCENLIVSEADEEEAKKSLALGLLNSDTSVKTKARVVDNLDLENYLELSQITPQEGEMYGALVGKDIIEDSAGTYEQLTSLSWPTREAFIANATKFEEYLMTLTLTNEELLGIMESSRIGTGIKKYLVNNWSAYTAVLSPAATRRSIEFAIENQLALKLPELSLLLPSAGQAYGVKLLTYSMEQLSRDDILTSLGHIGGEYSKLAQPNKRPSFENDRINETLLNHLEQIGIVNSQTTRHGRLTAIVKSSFV